MFWVRRSCLVLGQHEWVWVAVCGQLSEELSQWWDLGLLTLNTLCQTWGGHSDPSSPHTKHGVKVGYYHYYLLLYYCIVLRLRTPYNILLSVYGVQWSNFMVNYKSPSQTRELWRYRNRFQNIITVIVRYHHCATTLSDFVMSWFSLSIILMRPAEI